MFSQPRLPSIRGRRKPEGTGLSASGPHQLPEPQPGSTSKQHKQTIFSVGAPLATYKDMQWYRSCAGLTEINELQKLPNRAARKITNSSFDTPSRPLIPELRWKTIDDFVSIESKKMVFQSLNRLAYITFIRRPLENRLLLNGNLPRFANI